jgi:hypothetical protein
VLAALVLSLAAVLTAAIVVPWVAAAEESFAPFALATSAPAARDAGYERGAHPPPRHHRTPHRHGTSLDLR